MCAAAPSVARVSGVAVAVLGRSCTEEVLPRLMRGGGGVEDHQRGFPHGAVVGYSLVAGDVATGVV